MASSHGRSVRRAAAATVVAVLAFATSAVGLASAATGDSWTAHPVAAANNWLSVAYGNGVFVAISVDGTNRVMTSGSLLPRPTTTTTSGPTTTTTSAADPVVATPTVTG